MMLVSRKTIDALISCTVEAELCVQHGKMIVQKAFDAFHDPRASRYSLRPACHLGEGV